MLIQLPHAGAGPLSRLLFLLSELTRLVPAQVRAQTGVPLLRGGVKALFAGAGPSVLFRAAHGVLYLPLYCAVKQRNGRAGMPEPLAVASAAAAAVTATALIELPLEACMLVVKSAGGTFGAAARAALASPAGVAGLWAGAAPYGTLHRST